MSSPGVYTLETGKSIRIADFLPPVWIVQNLGPGNVWLTSEDAQGEQAGILIREFGHVRGGAVDAVWATTDTAGTKVTLIRDPLAVDILNLTPAAPAQLAGHIIADEGAPLTQRGTLNFAGAGVTVTDGPGDQSLVTIPGGAGADPLQGAYAPGSFTVPTGFYVQMANRIILTTTQRVTLEGDSVLRIN